VPAARQQWEQGKQYLHRASSRRRVHMQGLTTEHVWVCRQYEKPRLQLDTVKYRKCVFARAKVNLRNERTVLCQYVDTCRPAHPDLDQAQAHVSQVLEVNRAEVRERVRKR
jgi:hypothetical protein